MPRLALPGAARRPLVARVVVAALIGVALAPLTLTPSYAAPANDALTSPTVLTVPAGTAAGVTITNTGATRGDGDPGTFPSFTDSSDPDSYPCYGAASAWYRLSFPSAGRAVVTVAGADFDSALTVWKSSTSTPSPASLSGVSPAAPVASQRLGNAESVTAITIEFDVVTSGGPYLLEIAGCDPTNEGDAGEGMTGSATLTTTFVAKPANDNFSSAAALGATQIADIRGANATHEVNEPNSYGIDNSVCNGASSVWYATTPGVGQLTITTTAEEFDGVVTVAHGVPAATITQIDVARDPQVGTSNGHGDIVIDTVAGQRYWVRVEHCNADPFRAIIPLAELGTLTLASSFIAAPANDRYGSPKALSGATGSTPADISGATAEDGESSAATTEGFDVMKSVWFSWAIPITGSYVVDTSGAPFNTVLGVGTAAPAISGFEPDVATSDDVSLADLTSRVQFTATAGTKLRIRVSGVDDETHPSTGAFTLHYGPAPDTTAPTATITAPKAGARVSPSVPLDVSVQAADAGSGVARVVVSLSGFDDQVVTTKTGGVYVAQFDLTGTATNTPLTISAHAEDVAGNSSAVATRSITVDDGSVPPGYTGSTGGTVAAGKALGIKGTKGAVRKGSVWKGTKKGAAITIRFVGTRIDLLLAAGRTSGRATLTLDGVTTTVNLGSKKAKTLLRSFSGLAAVQHVLVITNTGKKGTASKGTLVQLSKLRVYNPT